VLFRTKAPELAVGVDNFRDVKVPKVVSASSIDIPHTKGANPSAIALDFRALKRTGDDLFEVTETTLVA
jgi:hypothetical protein